jgi:hypothetical protein
MRCGQLIDETPLSIGRQKEALKSLNPGSIKPAPLFYFFDAFRHYGNLHLSTAIDNRFDDSLLRPCIWISVTMLRSIFSLSG